MDPDFSNLSLSDSLPSDIGDDGSLSIESDSNVQGDQLPDFDPLSTDGVGTLDNINGSSNTNGDPTPAINSLFAGSNPLQDVLDSITGGATGLAAGLAGDFLNEPPNQPDSQSSSLVPVLLIGGGLIFLILVLK